jgi:hypothetical protein
MAESRSAIGQRRRQQQHGFAAGAEIRPHIPPHTATLAGAPDPRAQPLERRRPSLTSSRSPRAGA